MKCKECNKPIDKKRKFCSRSCSVTYHNRKRVKTHGNCAYCGEELIGHKKKHNKYCNATCSSNHRRKLTEDLIINNKHTGDEESHRKHAKRILIRETGHKCSMCGLTEWQGQPIPLVCDHKDGNPHNNKFENFRLICPNCDGLLPTFGGRNRGNGRKLGNK